MTEIKNINPAQRKQLIKWVVISFIVFVVVAFGGIGACKEFNRYQKRADAKNETWVRGQQILTYKKQVDIEKEKANVRRAEADGIRDAQDKIAQTLTPLYVQHEAIQKLPQARAVYIPSGAQGIPLVKTIDEATAP